MRSEASPASAVGAKRKTKLPFSPASATYTDTSGRRTDLLSYTEKDARRTRHIVSRVMTPSNRGGYIILSGSGALTVHEVSVTALESNS